MNAVMSMLDLTPRSLVEERAIRPPTIGKIRPGIKVLTRKAQENQKAVDLYRTMTAAGDSFETIGKVIESQLRLSNALVPKNVPYFVCRRSDFSNPATADEILKLYGEDRGDGIRLYRFPVMFAFDDWLRNVPNEMAVYTTTSRQFFSQYGPDGKRYCKTYAPVEKAERAQRVKRTFGGRLIVHRQDDDIPDGVCDPQVCPQYQARKCNLSATFLFVIPEIKGLGLIELPTNSIYVLQKAYSAMQTVSLARGRLTGTRFWLSKREFDITRIDDNGQAVRQKQMLTVLDADIDLGALLDAADGAVPALESANQAVALIEATGDTQVIESQGSGSQPESSTDPADYEPDPNESLDDKRDRMSDLLQRLGLSQQERQQDFKILGQYKYGRGWSNKLDLIDAMNRFLASALADRTELEAEIANAVQISSFV